MNRIQKFKINKLFGYQNVDLIFENNVMILMGENGLGKTSILNSLYFTLTQKWRKLDKINFESIELNIDNIEFNFTQEQLSAFIESSNNKRAGRYKNLKSDILNLVDINSLNKFIKENKNEKTDRHSIIYDFARKNRIINKLHAPAGLVIELLDKISKLPDLTSIENLTDYLDNNESLNILYFPTYRRVEEELHNLGKLTRINREEIPDLWNIDEREEIDDLEDETLIQFGMEDVDQRIKNIIAKINDSSIKGFAKVTGEMLHQLQEGFPKLTEEEILNINSNNVEIILNRVKNNLSEADRKNILRLLDSKELLLKKELAYFLTKLEDIYVQQRELDNSIKDFEKICNQYLVGKVFYFDESSVTLNIFNLLTNEKVELNQLSSGEKQIVSLFSKLYLEEVDNQLIFFDEPELSLSIKWQKQLLPHVLASGKCDFLLAVTHSPFIFDNNLDRYAVGMNTFID
ncbi:ATP-binding protein [Polaribacter vadi]|uniref:AAA family ATPase n=1 Tax=Polaribacter TaxID=52959 RepID=UPI001C0899E7|nr:MULTISPECIES: AAA family ATPase [Polaribacter]MBU3011098.1 ATP-binding protein [Polaribacter vadi]MDO6740912.1 AAA family ATPase [Polaribacter sp. 1_MG-2023]